MAILRDAGYGELADDIEETLRQARASLGVPDRHVYEAEMKQREQGRAAENTTSAG